MVFAGVLSVEGESMIDQHLVELQLLNSSVLMKRGKMNGSSSSMHLNGHSSAAAVAPAEDIEQLEGTKKQRKGRRGLSDVDQLGKIKHARRPSDIDSLSPEVLRALQSTFGGKLDEIRSRSQHRAPSPLRPSSPPPLEEIPPVPTPSSSPVRPATPSPASPEKPPTPPPSSPPSPAAPPAAAAAAVHTKTSAFVERLADREGLYMLIAYFSAIFLSGFILLATEQDDGEVEGPEEPCGGTVDSSCARLWGRILPTGITSIFFTLALVFFILDVSYSLLNILTAAEEFFSEAKKKSLSREGNNIGELRSGRPGLSAAGLALHFVIDLGFIIASSALLWTSKISTVDPLQAICEQRLQTVWMLGLMAMDVFILLSGIKSFNDPQSSDVCFRTAVKRVSVVLSLLLAVTAAYNYAVPESNEPRICARQNLAEETFKDCQMNQPLQLCGPGTNCPSREEPELPQCGWWPQCKTQAGHLDWCEANQQCDWPLAKQIQVYERKDVCSVVFPQCDWPLLKQIQPYEDKDRCVLPDLAECHWPWVKQIQLYEHEERCQAKPFQQCDWPRLKQVQLFTVQDRCPPKNPHECEWPFLKQIQLFESKDDSF